ncbi:MAG: hypothetical protein HRU20_26675 [Pseudomonadales bacterium]|nr:hypothetical protein [Pseudomonadales bacterium]
MNCSFDDKETSLSKIADFSDSDLTATLEEVFNRFDRLVDNNNVEHILTRRLAFIGSLMVLFGGLVMLSSLDFLAGVATTLTNESIFNSLTAINFTFNIALFDVIFLCFSTTIFLIYKLYSPLDKKCEGKSTKQKVKLRKDKLDLCMNLLMAFLLLSLLTIKVSTIAGHFLFFGIFIFVTAYSGNRKYGYTRSWSRNRLMRLQVELLYAEKKLGSDTDDNIRQKLHILLSDNYVQMHKDIVGDYIEYGDSALKFLAKKKS